MFKKGILFFLMGITALLGDTFNVSNEREFRGALENAAVNGSNDTIILDRGVYYTISDNEGTFTFADTEEYNLTITSAEGLNQDDVVLDGNRTNTVLNVNIGLGGVLFIDNLTIRGGIEPMSLTYDRNVGGIHTNVSLILSNSKILNCGGQPGGAISIIAGRGDATYLKVIDSNLTNNTSLNQSAAIYFADYAGTVELKNTLIYNNSGYNSGSYNNGSPLYISAENIFIENCIIEKNSSEKDGILRLLGNSFISSTKIINNRLDSRDGAVLNADTLEMKNSIMNSNLLYPYSSVMHMNGDVKLFNNIFSNHVSPPSPEIFSSTPDSMYRIDGKGILVNNVFTSNTTGNLGYRYYAMIQMRGEGYLVNNTFNQNTDTSDSDSAVLNFEGPVINTIFNDEENINAIFFLGDSSVYNTYVDYAKLIYSDYTVITQDNQKPYYGDIDLDNEGKPLSLNSLAVNNGLAPSSDTFKDLIGNNEDYNTILEILKTDIEGNPRIHGDEIDIGAYEYGSQSYSSFPIPVLLYLLN